MHLAIKALPLRDTQAEEKKPSCTQLDCRNLVAPLGNKLRARL